MTDRDPERMTKLLRKSTLNQRARALVALWAARGVAVSAVAHEQYGLLLARLRRGYATRPQRSENALEEVRQFTRHSDVLALLGWNVNEEPALLISADKLASNASALGQIYPDGFVLISELAGKALLVDLDEDQGTRTNVVDMHSTA